MQFQDENHPNIKISVENPGNFDLHVEVTLQTAGQAPVTRQYTFEPGPQTAALENENPSEIEFFSQQAAARHSPGLGAWHSLTRSIGKLTAVQGELVWFGLALLVYLLVRFIGLTDYPTHFTADEAISTLQANSFVLNGFHNTNHEFWPTYFQNIDKYSLGTSVYLNVLSNWLVGWSLAISRGYAVLIGLIAAVCVALILKQIFKLELWWASVLLLSMLPAWFQLSRTTYEVIPLIAFYTAGLYCYLLYRCQKPYFIYPAIVFFALGFYSYAPGQVITALTGLLLVISDVRYHWQQRKTLLLALPLAALVILPYLRFQWTHPGESWHYLTTLISYVTFDISPGEKVIYFLKQYLFFLSPFYWFRLETGTGTAYDSPLYLMNGHSLLPRLIFPFLVWGIWITLKNLRQAAYRAVLITFLVAPVSTSLILSPSSLPRQLIMVIPVTLLTMLGVSDLFGLAQKKIIHAWTQPVLTGLLVLALLVSNVALLVDALSGSASTFTDYSDSGLQFGAKWVFEMIREEAQKSPQPRFVVTPNWMMFPDLAQAFLLKDSPIRINYASIYDYARFKNPIPAETLFMLTEEEYQFAISNPKFSVSEIRGTIPYPNGEPGFRLVHLDYSAESDQLFAAEDAELRQPETTELLIDGIAASLRYSKTGDGEIRYVFDGDPATLYKSLAANPVTIEIELAQPRQVNGVFIIHGSSPIELKVETISENGEKDTFSAQFRENGIAGNPLMFDKPVTTRHITLTIRDLSQGYPGIVHIWEITLK